MSRFHFSSMHPTDGTVKKPIIENTSNHKSEQYVTTTEGTVKRVDAAVLVTEYKFTVQTSLAHVPEKFSLGQQRRASPPISEPMGNLVLGHDKEDRPSSPISNHKRNPPTKAEQMKDYGVVNNTRDRPKSPIRDHSRSSQEKVEPVKDYEVIENKSPIKVGPPTNYGVLNDKRDGPLSPGRGQLYSSPPKGSGVIDEKQNKPSTLVHDHGYKSPTKRVDETKIYGPVQTEASGPTRPGFPNGTNWRDLGGSNGYGEHTNYSNQYLDKPSTDTVRYEGVVPPYVPPTQLTPIFGPTNDIGEAVDVLKEVVKSAPPPRYNFNYPDSGSPIRDAYKEVIDSREAQRRYGNSKSSARPSPNSGVTITSTDAARKYGGKPV